MSVLGLTILFFVIAIVAGTVIALVKKPEISGSPEASDEAPIEPPDVAP